MAVQGFESGRAVAFHEAGHAVAGWLCGQRVARVEINGDDEHAGSCHLQRFPLPAREGGHEGDVVRDRLLCLACGLLAEARAEGRSDWDELSPELDQGVRLALALTDDCEAALRLLEATRERAEELLERHWQVVVTLAEALLGRGRLDAAELELLLRARLPVSDRLPTPL